MCHIKSIMNIKTTIAFSCVLLSLLTTALSVWAAPSTASAHASVCSTPTIYTNLTYPNGKPAADATAILNIVNKTTHAVTTIRIKADQAGLVNFTLKPHELDNSTLVSYFTSPAGIGFWAFPGPFGSNGILKPFTQVRIHMVDAKGNPIAHKQICPQLFAQRQAPGSFDLVPYESWNPAIQSPWTQTTDANGYATLTNLPQGYDLTLEVLDNSYATLDSGSAIHLAKRSVTPDAVVKIPPACSLSGTILYGATHKPAVGVSVGLSWSMNEGPRDPVVTDSLGHYVFTRLPPRTYILTPCGVNGNLDNWITPSDTVSTAPGPKAATASFTLMHGGLILGRITYKGTKNPVEFVHISATKFKSPPEFDDTRWATSNNHGAYSVRVLPGKVGVLAFTNDNSIPEKQIDIAEGQVMHVDFQMPPKKNQR